MSTEIKFEGFKKIPRLSKEMVITEKLDGTNGLIVKSFFIFVYYK